MGWGFDGVGVEVGEGVRVGMGVGEGVGMGWERGRKGMVVVGKW